MPLNDLCRLADVQPGEVGEVCIAHRFRNVATKRFSRKFFNRVRGVVGMEIAHGDAVARFAPTQMIAANLGFERAVERFLSEQGVTAGDFAANGTLRAFSAEQFLLPDGVTDEAIRLFRGSTPVDESPTSGEDHARELAEGIGQWMTRNLSTEGRIPYKYWPSRGTESPADNAIRNFLASWSLARLAKLKKSMETSEAARRNCVST